MEIRLIFLSSFLTVVRAEGFLSKFLNYGRMESDLNIRNHDVNVCETVKIMPRIGMAIVGGATLKSDVSAPYIVAIGENLPNGSVSWYCGGSLLTSEDILTAAHCLISRNATVARLGSFSTKQKRLENDYKISRTVIHPSYKITESYHDIALIKLKEKINFGQNIKPICLPETDWKYEGQKAKVIGWGAEEFGGDGTQKLKQVEVRVLSNEDCEKAYRNSTIAPKVFPTGIKEKQLCAGSSRGGKDACQGDSGGPLVLQDDSGVIRLIGIVSTGTGCGSKMYPGVYTRVSSYIDWIQKNVENSSKSGGESTRHRNRKSLTVKF